MTGKRGTLGVDYNSGTISLSCVNDPKVLATASLDITNLALSIPVVKRLLQALLGEFTLDNKIWIEQPWVNGKQFPRSGLMMARTAAIIEVIATEIGIEVNFVHPLTWRKELYGNGRPKDPKNTAVKYVEEHFQYKVPTLGKTARSQKPDHNLAEAICIAAYGQLQ